MRGGKNEQIRNETMKLLRQSCGGGVEMSCSSGGDNQQRRATRAMPELSPSGERRWSSSSLKGTQQSIIKPASTVRNVVAMTARAMLKAARAMGAGSTRMTMTKAMPEPSPREEGDDGPPPAARVHINQILSRHQRQGTGRNLQGGHAVMGK